MSFYNGAAEIDKTHDQQVTWINSCQIPFVITTMSQEQFPLFRGNKFTNKCVNN